ncbi:hypothetical protein Tco_1466325 [Tanacetum coccineum]
MKEQQKKRKRMKEQKKYKTVTAIKQRAHKGLKNKGQSAEKQEHHKWKRDPEQADKLQKDVSNKDMVYARQTQRTQTCKRQRWEHRAKSQNARREQR